MPKGNSSLTALFRQLGMVVDEVTSTDKALTRLDQHTYDIVISDIHRGTDSQAGIEMLRAFRFRGISLPVIIHAARFDARRRPEDRRCTQRASRGGARCRQELVPHQRTFAP
ncbi:response regulator [Microbispora triticiradicis]